VLQVVHYRVIWLCAEASTVLKTPLIWRPKMSDSNKILGPESKTDCPTDHRSQNELEPVTFQVEVLEVATLILVGVIRNTFV
jgi:hypothetical protein